MKKETFLSLIQQTACMGGQAQEVWDHAIGIDERDPRWKGIYDESQSVEEHIRQFCREFGIEYRKPVKRPKIDQVARFEKKITAAKERGTRQEDIDYLEKQLRYWQGRQK